MTATTFDCRLRHTVQILVLKYIIIIVNKISNTSPSGKNTRRTKIDRPTPQALVPPKTEKHAQRSNQRIHKTQNGSNVEQGRSFNI